MTKRRGASLINVMVFMMFAVMVTAQVFFFTKSSSDSLAEGREIMLYRLHLQSLVEEAKDALKETGTQTIGHLSTLETNTLNYSQFLDSAKLFSDNNLTTEWKNSDGTYTYHVSIHDLDYSFDATVFNRTIWTDKDTGYGNENAHRKIFAAMPPLGEFELNASNDIVRNAIGKPEYSKVYNRFYLIRAWTQLPENYYGAKLMYQVLVSRDEADSSSATYHNIETLSFQEVWY